ncbi:hypothetical protein [Actinoplanes sp. HUAS TT8]|uniref:hypothetical protein n=1 Tax=Actinoplanes sp. HUAS TT8 TaxID=3447453 RepID=UPI003F520D0B
MSAVVGAWIVVLALLSWWSIRNDPATVPEQRSVGQAMPALRKAAGVLLAAVDRAVAQGVAAPSSTPADGAPWAVRIGAVRADSCELTPVRDGVEAGRDVYLYVPQGRAQEALERVAAALPKEYRAGVVAARVGTKLSLFGDAGDFIAVEAEGQADDQVLTLSVATGCRPGTVPRGNDSGGLSEELGSDPAAGVAPTALGETLAALGGRAGAAVSTQVVACPGGGVAATYQATGGASGDGPRGVPAGATPVWSGAGGWAYGKGSESVVVDDNGENLQVSVTTTCAQ